MAVLIYALTSYKNAMHTCTGNLNISPGFESFEILRIPNFPPTLKIYVGESILTAKRLYTTTDLNNVKDAGLVFAGEGVPNAPVPYVYILTLVSENPNDTIQIGFSIVSKQICIRAMSKEGWRPWRII